MSDIDMKIVCAAHAYTDTKEVLISLISSMTVKDYTLFDPTDPADQLICLIEELKSQAKELLSLSR
jgi:hypothetical protein